MKIEVKESTAKFDFVYNGTLNRMGEALRTITTNTGDRVELIGENCGVFYNKDCGKYGVKWHCICHAYGNHWPQIPNIKGKTYTKYKKTAERWARELLAKHGDKAQSY